MDGLKEIGRWLPRFVVTELSKKIHGLKLSKKRLLEVLLKICEKFDLHVIDANESAGIPAAQLLGAPRPQHSTRTLHYPRRAPQDATPRRPPVEGIDLARRGPPIPLVEPYVELR